MEDKKYISLNAVAYVLGLPKAYIRRLAEAGSIPTIRTGKQILANLEAVEKALAEMAAKGAGNDKK